MQRRLLEKFFNGWDGRCIEFTRLFIYAQFVWKCLKRRENHFQSKMFSVLIPIPTQERKL